MADPSALSPSLRSINKFTDRMLERFTMTKAATTSAGTHEVPTNGSAPAASHIKPRPTCSTYTVIDQYGLLLGVVEFTDGSIAILRPHKGRRGIRLKIQVGGQRAAWLDRGVGLGDLPDGLEKCIYRLFLAREAQRLRDRASKALTALAATARDRFASIADICVAFQKVNEVRALRRAESNHLKEIIKQLPRRQR